MFKVTMINNTVKDNGNNNYFTLVQNYAYKTKNTDTALVYDDTPLKEPYNRNDGSYYIIRY